VAAWRDSRPWPRSLRPAFSAYGYLFLFLGTAVAAIVAREVEVVLVLVVVLVLAALSRSPAWRLLARWQLWAFLLPTVALSALLMGERDLHLWWLWLSPEGFWAGMWMAGRALSIGLAAAVFTSAVSVSQISQLFEGWRLKGLGFALGVATNVLPGIQETMETSYQAMRLRGGFRTRRLRTLKLLLVALIAGSLRRGDDIVSAAESRAFDPDRPLGPSISPTRADLALAAGCGIVAAALLLV
jgi:energy-coupling factor transporter transmembrane protein EcfT